jgi:hypothetical protein
MTITIDQRLSRDSVAFSLGRAVANATDCARQAGIPVEEWHLIIQQVKWESPPIWRIAFLPEAGVLVRGGDFVVEVDAIDGSIKQSYFGQ